MEMPKSKHANTPTPCAIDIEATTGIGVPSTTPAIMIANATRPSQHDARTARSTGHRWKSSFRRRISQLLGPLAEAVRDTMTARRSARHAIACQLLLQPEVLAHVDERAE